MVYKMAYTIGHKPKLFTNLRFFSRLKNVEEYNHLPDKNIKCMLLPSS